MDRDSEVEAEENWQAQRIGRVAAGNAGAEGTGRKAVLGK